VDDETRQPGDQPEPTAETLGSDLGQDIGVYLLDAALPAERVEFERAADALPEVRAEAVALAPVVVAMGRIYELAPEQALGAFDTSVEPTAQLKERVTASAAAAPAQTTPRPLRPQGRVRGGLPAEPTPIRRGGLWRTPWAAAAAMFIIAVGVTLYSLGIQNKLDDRNREIHAQATEIAQIRTSQNASAYNVTATKDEPAAVTGTVFYSAQEQQAAVVLTGLPAVTTGRAYQIWFISGNNAPQPGPTFKPNADGSVVFTAKPSISSFDLVAFTNEPETGSTAPTTAILMTGSVGGAAG